MIDWNDCLPTKEMQVDFERFKEPSEAGLKATVNACNDYIERVEEAILRDKLGELPEAISFSYIAKKYFGKSRNWLYQRRLC